MEETGKTTAAGYANDGISSIAASELGSSKCDLVRDGGPNPNELFEGKYGKWWPFRLVKTIICLLLLAITVGAGNCVDSNLHLDWSKCWDFIRYYYDPRDWNRKNSDQLFANSCFLMALAFISFVLHWIGKKRSGKSLQFMASIGILNICLSLFMASMLVPIMFNFTCRSIAEIRWFHPRLLNESMTLAEFVEWDEDRRGSYDGWYEYYDGFRRRLTTTTTPSPVPTTFAPWIVKQQEERKIAVMFRLWMDPTIAILTFLAIFLNLVYAVRLLWLFKQTKVWSSDYGGTRPNCSQLDKAYARFWPFGLLKLVHWILPLGVFSICLYIENYGNNANFLIMAIISLIWFFQWIFYVQTVRLNPGSVEKQQQQHDLAGKCKKDLIYSVAAILVYLFLRFVIFVRDRSDDQPIQVLLIVLICLHAASMLFTFTILVVKRRGDGPNSSGVGLKIPAMSVNFSVNVHKYDVALSAVQKPANANVDVEEGGENAK